MKITDPKGALNKFLKGERTTSLLLYAKLIGKDTYELAVSEEADSNSGQFDRRNFKDGDVLICHKDVREVSYGYESKGDSPTDFDMFVLKDGTIIGDYDITLEEIGACLPLAAGFPNTPIKYSVNNGQWKTITLVAITEGGQPPYEWRSREW